MLSPEHLGLKRKNRRNRLEEMSGGLLTMENKKVRALDQVDAHT